MRRFCFRLDKVQRLRLHAERLARLRLADEMGALAALEQRVDNVRHSLAVCRDGDGMMVAAGLARVLEAGLRRSCGRLERAVDSSERRVQQAALVFQGCRRDTRVLELLREQRVQAWKQEALAAEQMEIDESARVRFTPLTRDPGVEERP